MAPWMMRTEVLQRINIVEHAVSWNNFYNPRQFPNSKWVVDPHFLSKFFFGAYFYHPRKRWQLVLGVGAGFRWSHACWDVWQRTSILPRGWLREGRLWIEDDGWHSELSIGWTERQIGVEKLGERKRAGEGVISGEKNRSCKLHCQPKTRNFMLNHINITCRLD